MLCPAPNTLRPRRALSARPASLVTPQPRNAVGCRASVEGVARHVLRRAAAHEGIALARPGHPGSPPHPSRMRMAALRGRLTGRCWGRGHDVEEAAEHRRLRLLPGPRPARRRHLRRRLGGRKGRLLSRPPPSATNLSRPPPAATNLSRPPPHARTHSPRPHPSHRASPHPYAPAPPTRRRPVWATASPPGAARAARALRTGPPNPDGEGCRHLRPAAVRAAASRRWRGAISRPTPEGRGPAGVPGVPAMYILRATCPPCTPCTVCAALAATGRDWGWEGRCLCR
jgi:hypothetical protein